MTREEIYLEKYRKAPSSMNFYDYKRIAVEAMEEYGKLMYNQGVSDSLGAAVQQSGWITDEIVNSILILKK